MKIQAKQVDSVNASASVEIQKQIIENELEKLAKKAAKTMKMDGFRKGKVPLSIIIKRYGKDLQNDAEQGLLKQAFDEALKQLQRESKDIVGEPYFEKFERKDEGLFVELLFSFKPQIKLDGYEALIPSYTSPKISKKELDEKKQGLLKSFARTEPIKEDRALKEKDFAEFDFEGFIDGKAFDGGKAENFKLEIGSKQFIPGFEEAMIGMKAGEEKEIKLEFPKDYGVAHLASKEALFKIKLHKILENILPKLDEELLKKLLPDEKEINEEKLDEKLKAQIKQEKMYKLINDELKDKFAQALVEKYDFDLPKGVVEQEIDIQFRAGLNKLSQEELKNLEKDKEKIQKQREEYRSEAEKSVKLTFIINELATLRKIGVSDQEVIQAVYFEAYRYGQNPKELLQNYRQNGLLPAVKMAIVEERLFNELFSDNAKEEKE